jgi:hypothetical protein
LYNTGDTKNTESITQSVDIADQHTVYEQEAHMELEQSQPIVYQVKLYGILHETLKWAQTELEHNKYTQTTHSRYNRKLKT